MGNADVGGALTNFGKTLASGAMGIMAEQRKLRIQNEMSKATDQVNLAMQDLNQALAEQKNQKSFSLGDYSFETSEGYVRDHMEEIISEYQSHYWSNSVAPTLTLPESSAYLQPQYNEIFTNYNVNMQNQAFAWEQQEFLSETQRRIKNHGESGADYKSKLKFVATQHRLLFESGLYANEEDMRTAIEGDQLIIQTNEVWKNAQTISDYYKGLEYIERSTLPDENKDRLKANWDNLENVRRRRREEYRKDQWTGFSDDVWSAIRDGKIASRGTLKYAIEDWQNKSGITLTLTEKLSLEAVLDDQLSSDRDPDIMTASEQNRMNLEYKILSGAPRDEITDEMQIMLANRDLLPEDFKKVDKTLNDNNEYVDTVLQTWETKLKGWADGNSEREQAANQMLSHYAQWMKAIDADSPTVWRVDLTEEERSRFFTNLFDDVVTEKIGDSLRTKFLWMNSDDMALSGEEKLTQAIYEGKLIGTAYKDEIVKLMEDPQLFNRSRNDEDLAISIFHKPFSDLTNREKNVVRQQIDLAQLFTRQKELFVEEIGEIQMDSHGEKIALDRKSGQFAIQGKDGYWYRVNVLDKNEIWQRYDIGRGQWMNVEQ
jgi:enamine deaminase RidA (YjgF/YER057c/UK114 family)